MKNNKLMIGILIIIAVVGLGAYILNHTTNTPPQTTVPTNPPPAADTAVTYTNNQYGFTFSLPADWKGYSIVTSSWTGYPEDGTSPQSTGTKLLLRNPNWTAANHYEDIPILIFTLAEWNLYTAGDFSVSAAPIPASELGRNNIYVFALPPRWDYDFSQGYQEAENIVNSKPLHPFDVQASVNGNCGLTVSSIAPNSQASFPLTISGTIDNSNKSALGCSWQMFEGQAGSAQLSYSSGNTWHPVGAASPIKAADWTAEKTSFSTTLDFDNTKTALKSGTLLKVTFTEENPSGMTPVDTYDLPLLLK